MSPDLEKEGRGWTTEIVSEIRNFLQTNHNYLREENTNSGPVGTYGNVS